MPIHRGSFRPLNRPQHTISGLVWQSWIGLSRSRMKIVYPGSWKLMVVRSV
jgi:hypothetical protein